MTALRRRAAQAQQAALRPWDKVWRVKRPASFVPGLYRLHQVTAFHLLTSNFPLNEWSAAFLQTIAYQVGDLTPAQSHWLRHLEDEAEGRAAA